MGWSSQHDKTRLLESYLSHGANDACHTERWSVNFVQELVKQEETQHGVKSDRVVVGGFSQGGAVSLRTALTSEIPLGGCVALSCYLPGNQENYTTPQHHPPIFQAHGEEDEVVTYKRGQLTAEVVSRLVNKPSLMGTINLSHTLEWDMRAHLRN